jgi:hypothetical protein
MIVVPRLNGDGTPRGFSGLRLLPGFVALLLSAWPVMAVPYASSLTNAGGFLSFRLNEPAQQVSIIADGATNELGPLTAGLHTVSLDATGIVQVSVFQASPPGFATPFSQNAATVLRVGADGGSTRFNSPRGLAINTDPTSAFFGQIYVANSAAGLATNADYGPVRPLGDGLYALNSDLSDALGQEDTAWTSGLDFMTNSDLAPYRLSLGPDGSVYVCDFSERSGGLYRVDPDLRPDSGTNVLGGDQGGAFPVGDNRNHGSIAAAVISGSLLASNLSVQVIDEDLQLDPNATVRFMLNSVWRHDLGGSLPGSTGMPELQLSAPWFRSAGQIMDLVRAPSGNFYVTDYRAAGNDRAGLYQLSFDFTVFWDSLDQTRQLSGNPEALDLLAGTSACAVSPDGRWVAVIHQDTCVVTLLQLAGGTPDLANRLSFAAFDHPIGLGADLAFDAAGNLYVLSGGAQALRVFSPGGATTTVTGSDGVFQLIRPPAVTVLASRATTREGSADPGVFTFVRQGDTNEDLLLHYTLAGSALNGVDYEAVPLELLLPSGATNAELHILPIDDNQPEPTQQAIVTLLGSPTYDLLFPATAAVAIVDDEPPALRISVLKSNAQERLSSDHIVFQLEREGATNFALAVAYTLAGGTAVPGQDFEAAGGAALPAMLTLAAGQTRQRLELQAIDDHEYEGTETIVASLLPGPNYTLDEPATATGFILDDEPTPLPESSTLFQDDFETDTSTNWNIRFGANNGIYDAEVFWSFDYRLLGIPPAPNSRAGTGRGLLVQVNKTNSLAGGSAGINFYPKDRTFAGDYALRFDLFVHLGDAAPSEHTLVGLNHSGSATNRVTQSADPNSTTRGGDGIWFALGSDGSDARDCAAYTVPFPATVPVMITNRESVSLAEVFPAPPYALTGSPGNAGAETPTWTQVEFSQVQGQLTLRLNQRVACSFPNPTPFTFGTILIGLNDQFDSIGSGGFDGNFVVFDNVRVLTYQLAVNRLVVLPSGQVQIDFVSPAGGDPEEFQVQWAAQLPARTWELEADAVISAEPGGYRAIVPQPADNRFYRIQNVGPAVPSP